MPPEIKLFPCPSISETPIMPEPAVMQSGRIPFPEVATKTIFRHPELETLILEMAATDPRTFLHSVMVAECYVLLREEHIKRIALSPKKLAVIDGSLRSRNVAALLHDIGKWTITDDPKLSVKIVNSPPADNINPYDKRAANGKIITAGRNSNDKSTHKLHPLTGIYSILALASINPFIPNDQLRNWAEPAGGHHEHFRDEIVINFNGKFIPSYPRSKLRFTHDFEDRFYLLLKMADTAVAMGQPRTYRNYRLADDKINESLDNILTNFFAYLGKRIDRADIEKRQKEFKEMTMTALKYIQARYSEEVCKNINGFTDAGGQPYPPKQYQDAFLLGRLARHVWSHNQERFEKARNGTIFFAPSI